MLSNHLILCRPLLLLPSISPSIRVFSHESALPIRRPKYWSFSISPSNEYSGLISFRTDWFYLLGVQGTLKSLFQHHSLKASILRPSAFFMVQLSHPYTTPGKTTALTRWAFVSAATSLPLSRCPGLLSTITLISVHPSAAPLPRLSPSLLEYGGLACCTCCLCGASRGAARRGCLLAKASLSWRGL